MIRSIILEWHASLPPLLEPPGRNDLPQSTMLLTVHPRAYLPLGRIKETDAAVVCGARAAGATITRVMAEMKKEQGKLRKYM